MDVSALRSAVRNALDAIVLLVGGVAGVVIGISESQWFWAAIAGALVVASLRVIQLEAQVNSGLKETPPDDAT